jgi:hypothetical protein
MMRTCAACVVGVGLLVSTSGCGGGDAVNTGDPTAKGKLEEFKAMLETVAVDRQKPPSRMAEFGAVEPMLPVAGEAFRKGELVYVWGTTLSPGGTGVVAYEKNAPTEGGWVLIQDGTVKQMTAEEFKAAPKAAK